MRLVDWNEFVTLPAGTIYSLPEDWDGDSLRMKGDTISIDGEAFDYHDTNLLPSVLDSSSIFHDDFPDQDPDGGRRVLLHPSGWMRDGMYDKTHVYWVWEQEDRERLARWLLNPEATADGDELNEDNIRWRGDSFKVRA